MDSPPPHRNQNQPDSIRNTQVTKRDAGATGPDQTDTSTAGPPAAARQPQCSSGFTVIPPDESRRSKLIAMAQKGEEERQRWKETHRVSCVQPSSERLGGDVTLAEAREKQLRDLRCSKVQKQLRQKELDERKRQEEEEALQKMKDEQRRKTERLEERERRDQQRRRQQLGPDHDRKLDRFLQGLERRAPGPPASSAAAHTSSTSEVVQCKQRGSVQLDHRRVNSAFLDNLEGRGGGGGGGSGNPATWRDGAREAEPPSAASGGSGRWAPAASGRQLPSAHLRADPEQSWTQEADCDSALMTLVHSFPGCSRVVLEEVLEQCDGDCDRAAALLR